MRMTRTAAVLILLCVGAPAFAHRLDEYLQATTISVEKDRVHAEIRLTPGVEVLPIVLPNIDTDADGVMSEVEQQAYAERMLRDLSLTVDGDRLRLRLVSWTFAKLEEMQEGLGDIQLQFIADVPRSGHNRRLTFENHHQSGIAAYLVNALVPRDPDIQITSQNRNYQQSFYELDYVQTGVGSGPLSFTWSSFVEEWLVTAALLLFAGLALLLRWRARAANEALAQK
jgi:hypothetical protein